MALIRQHGKADGADTGWAFEEMGIRLSGNPPPQELTCVDVWKNEKAVIPIQMTTAKNTIETASHANAIFAGGRDWKSALAANVAGSVMKSMKRENQEEFCSSRTDKTNSIRMLNRDETKTAMSMRGIVLIRVSPEVFSVFADATSDVDFIPREIRKNSRVIVNRIVGNGEEIIQ
jgi:hypothetical protein